MNKHTKVAVLVAPLLAVLGYVASDYFIENDADEIKLITLVPESSCAVLAGECVLISGDFKVNVFDKAGSTVINSTFPLDEAVLFLVDGNNNATPYPLTQVQSNYYWQAQTPLRELAATSASYKLRLIASIKGGNYISEFETLL
ncbi:MAG: ethanolamine utilization microcompartment shell protein EutS [Moritella dasanensis]|jgi:ethanolamine utilization microcompartment shell protein EutS